MGPEDLLAIVEGVASVNDWRRFGPMSHLRTVAATALYGYSLLAPSTCFPDQQAMLCKAPSQSYFEGIATSAHSVTGPAVVLSGNVTIMTSTDGTGKLYTMHKPS